MRFNFNEVELKDFMIKADGETYTGKFIDLRINEESVPKDLFTYYLRHGDDGDWCSPVSIEKGNILVDFCGMFFTKEEIPEERFHVLKREGSDFKILYIDINDYSYLEYADEEVMTNEI